MNKIAELKTNSLSMYGVETLKFDGKISLEIHDTQIEFRVQCLEMRINCLKIYFLASGIN